MKLHQLKSKKGARHRKNRVGRGHSAGQGKQAGKGQSGQNKRGGTRPGFEGGQNPLFRRLPKRGFKNVNHIKYQIVSLAILDKYFKDGDQVDFKTLYQAKIIRDKFLPIKVLANGKIKNKLIIRINAISKNARQAIEKVGGKVEVI